jgi:hypothetical protein
LLLAAAKQLVLSNTLPPLQLGGRPRCGVSMTSPAAVAWWLAPLGASAAAASSRDNSVLHQLHLRQSGSTAAASRAAASGDTGGDPADSVGGGCGELPGLLPCSLPLPDVTSGLPPASQPTAAVLQLLAHDRQLSALLLPQPAPAGLAARPATCCCKCGMLTLLLWLASPTSCAAAGTDMGAAVALLLLVLLPPLPYLARSSCLNFSCLTPGGREDAKDCRAWSTVSPQCAMR